LVDAAKFASTSPLQLDCRSGSSNGGSGSSSSNGRKSTGTSSGEGNQTARAAVAAVCCEADFVCVSFYKLFGYPTGLGALIVRHDAAKLLAKHGSTRDDHRGSGDRSSSSSSNNSGGGSEPLCQRYFGGGSLAAALAGSPWQRFRADSASRLSDGTEHFLGIVALRAGLDRFESDAWGGNQSGGSLGGYGRVSAHASACSHRLAAQLYALRHPNGARVVQLYGHWPTVAARADAIAARRVVAAAEAKSSHTGRGGGECGEHGGSSSGGDDHNPAALRWQAWAAAAATASTARAQGPVVTFSVLRPNGSLVGYAEVQAMAALHKPPIQLRAGCFCNPGACQVKTRKRHGGDKVGEP
jgi:hypothetical protein